MIADLFTLVATEISSVLQAIFMPSSSRHYWLYMLSYLIIALLIYLFFRDPADKSTFWGFLFPSRIYKNPSVLMDFKIWLVIIVIIKVGLFGFIYTSVGVVSGLMERAIDLLGPGWQAQRVDESPGVGDRLIFTLLTTCCIDFGFFIMHYCQHKISWLWAFHKVHHSAAVLTPATANRHHPVDYTLSATMAVLLSSLATVIFSRYHGTQIDTYTLLNTSAIHLFYYMTANLRHSHIWFSFGRRISLLCVSPAMHQIHHSVDRRHFDKNFGYVFSIWDWLFRCRYIPQQKENIEVGLADGERGYSGVLDAMVRPFGESFEKLLKFKSWRRRSPWMV